VFFSLQSFGLVGFFFGYVGLNAVKLRLLVCDLAFSVDILAFQSVQTLSQKSTITRNKVILTGFQPRGMYPGPTNIALK